MIGIRLGIPMTAGRSASPSITDLSLEWDDEDGNPLALEWDDEDGNPLALEWDR